MLTAFLLLADGRMLRKVYKYIQLAIVFKIYEKRHAFASTEKSRNQNKLRIKCIILVRGKYHHKYVKTAERFPVLRIFMLILYPTVLLV